MKCLGHKQIEELNFPFYDNNGILSIDMEGCGETLEGKQLNYLEIKFCPVCGKRLEAK